jgi:hypothetical protein
MMRLFTVSVPHFENDSKTIPVHARVKGNVKGLIDGMNITAIVSSDNVLSQSVPE